MPGPATYRHPLRPCAGFRRELICAVQHGRCEPPCCCPLGRFLPNFGPLATAAFFFAPCPPSRSGDGFLTGNVTGPMSHLAEYAGLFAAALASATVFPFQSEVV